MWLEILLVMAAKAQVFGGITLFISCVLMLMGLIIWSIEASSYVKYCVNQEKSKWDSHDRDTAFWYMAGKKLAKYGVVVALIAFPLAAIPSVDDLWRVRIGLIKLHLASPENIEKGAETIERLGKKLECKYLRCDEKTPAELEKVGGES